MVRNIQPFAERHRSSRMARGRRSFAGPTGLGRKPDRPRGLFRHSRAEPGLFSSGSSRDCPAAVSGMAGGWLSLNDCTENGSVEALYIFDAEGRMVEAVEYIGLLGYERGRSLERFSTDACSSLQGGIWHRCPAAGRATPGMVNTSNTERSVPAGEVRVSPRSLMPAKGVSAVISGARLPGRVGIRDHDIRHERSGGQEDPG